MGAATVALMFVVWGNVTQIRSVSDYRSSAKLTTRVFSSDGELLGEIYEERRTLVDYDKIPKHVVQAFLAAEDADFFSHGGIDYLGMARALWKDVVHGGVKQGGSTITQQVAKTFYLTRERSIKRKVKEIVLARKLESALSKQDILFLYLNQIYFGHGRYGLQEAAHFYFGKNVTELEVGEAALLAGLPKGPNDYSPLRNPAAAKSRQRYVLGQMAAKGFITPAVARELSQKDIAVVDPALATPFLGSAPEVVDEVKRELGVRYGADKLAQLGLTVRVTVNAKMQRAAREALETGLREVDARHGFAAATEHLKPAQIGKRLKQYARERKGKPRPGKAYPAIVTAVDDTRGTLAVDLGDLVGDVALTRVAAAGTRVDTRYNPGGKLPSARFTAGDVVWVRRSAEASEPAEPESGDSGEADDSAKAPSSPAPADDKGATPKSNRLRLTIDLGPQAALVAIDPSTRKILALVGGYDFRAGDFNRATQAKRQPGSAFKPFVYGAALKSGLFTAASIVNDAPEVYDTWKPQNAQKTFRGPVRVRVAMTHSINTVAIRLIASIGTEPVRELARACGIKSELTSEPSLSLGASEVTPIELVNAYASIATGGTTAEPMLIESIGDKPEPAAKTHTGMSPDLAYVLTSLMTSVVKEGTAKRALVLKRDVAGKTGTSNFQNDAWFVGFTPDLVTGVWVGFDEGRSLGAGEAGGKSAVPIFVDFMGKALKDRLPMRFRTPAGVVSAKIDPRTGKLAAAGARDALDEVFLEGTVPTEVAPAVGEVAPDSFVVDQAAED